MVPLQTSCNLDNLENIELGYRLKKDYWGKVLQLKDHWHLMEIAEKSIHKKVWAHAMLGNIASINVMKKIGLIHDHDDIYENWQEKIKDVFGIV